MMARPTNSTERKASVLLAVLVIIVLLSLAAFQYNELMIAEYQAADTSCAAQAQAAAESGIHYVAAVLSNKDAVAGTLGGNPYDNEGAFGNQSVGVGRFSIVAPQAAGWDGTGPTDFRYGVTDESGKINLNALLKIDSTGQAASEILLKLPNMEEAGVVDAILDWLDADEDQRTEGAENTYYSALEPSYRCKNGNLDSVEELLLVRGVTPELLFGTDRNRNGMEDPGEDDGNGWDPGWAAYLTVYSREPNVDSEAAPRIFLNDTDVKALYEKLAPALGESMADFIVLFRTQTASGSQQADRVRDATPQEIREKVNALFEASGGSRPRSLASRYELIGASITFTVGSGRNQSTVRVRSPLQSADTGRLEQDLPALLDKTTTQQLTELPARVNVNTAPREVLMCLPGMTDAEVQSILDNQPGTSGGAQDTAFQTPAWLMLKGNMTPERMRALERYVGARTQVYRVQSVGRLERGGPMARVEAVIDTNNGKPRILMMRNLSELGRGYDLSR